jgi:general secretion pathway protein D
MKMPKSKSFSLSTYQAGHPFPIYRSVLLFLCLCFSTLSGNVKPEATASSGDGQDSPSSVPLKPDVRSLKPDGFFEEQPVPAISLPAKEPRLVVIEKFFAQAAPPPATSPPIAVPQPVAPQPVAPVPAQQFPQNFQATPQQIPAPVAPAPVVAPYRPPPAIGSPSSPYGFKTYRLGYMQSDRVIALLKSLGYSTVEYSAMRGESVNESIFSVIQGTKQYPLIVKIIDAAKTSLMQPAMDGGRSAAGTNSLGGTYLHQQTTGAPEQRLLFVYEKAFPDQLHALVELLRNEIDVPASQIVIEALVVEINTDKAKELGMQLNLSDKKAFSEYSYLEGNPATPSGKFRSSFSSNERSPFSNQRNFYFDTTAVGTYVDSAGAVQDIYPGMTRANPLGLHASISAYVSQGHAEVLSNPSILVLDGRQARIQVGRQVPNRSTLLGQNNTNTVISVSYIPTGIVLNIRPRITEDGSEVTMQIETIVSNAIFDPKNLTAPPQIENKQVQTFVRVADNTPFIVGGLISKNKDKGSTGVPVLSEIPVLGNLFKKKLESNADREVIIVLTPHVIDTNQKSFSYVIPKDSQSFDSFDNLLFRNAYRIRDDDLFDLSFATKSEFYRKILAELSSYKLAHPELAEEEPVFQYLKNRVPGEEVIVRRMIWEIVHKSKFHQHIADDHILLFESNDEAKYGNKFKTHLLSVLLGKLEPKVKNSFIFDFADHKAKSAGPFEHPRALISTATVTNPGSYIEQMSMLNANDPNRNRILLSSTVAPPGVRGATALEVLKGVLVLKRILALNSSMPVTIDEFRVGRQIIFPTEQELKDKYHVVDYDVAKFFYEVINYYPEFETAFNRDSASIILQMRGIQQR